MKPANLLIRALLFAPLATLQALDYPYVTAEPQKTGWPLTAEERAYVVDKPEHDRRPGREANKHLPKLWPVVPSAGHFGGDAWLKLHEAHVKTVQANKGPIDVLLVGDSITIQWGESWRKHFPDLKAVNIGIGGDKTQNVLWRLDHGGVEGLQPKAIVLMIGNNNMFFTPETGIEAAALGIQMCVKNLREKFPQAVIIVAKILPAHAPGNRFYEDIKKTNAALDPLKLDSDPKLRVLDLWSDFTNAGGTIKKDLLTPDNIHLSPDGYAAYAERLKPFLKELAVAISRGDDFTKWEIFVIQADKSLGTNLWGESTVIVEKTQIINIARRSAGRVRGHALVSISKDHGRTWTPAAASNLPMATQKPYAGILSTGQRYLIGTITADTDGRRSPLTIAVSKPDESLFSRVFLIRTSVFDGTPGVSAPNADFSYPYAVERNGQLYIGYTDKEHIYNELAVIPVSSLEIKP